MISASKGAIFRKEAVEKYSQGRDKNVLPQFVLPPVFVFLWCLLALFVSAGVTAWLGQVPVYAISEGGILLDPGTSGSTANGEMAAVIFIPYSSSLHLQVGQPVNMQIGQTGPKISTAIGAVESQILSPSQVRKEFAVAVTDPSIVVVVAVESNLSSYSGSPVQAQVEIGSRRLLSLFPGLGDLVKDT